ncbi:hypothetical protein Droror1_Dr00008524 [Drosera rotundifolia]
MFFNFPCIFYQFLEHDTSTQGSSNPQPDPNLGQRTRRTRTVATDERQHTPRAATHHEQLHHEQPHKTEQNQNSANAITFNCRQDATTHTSHWQAEVLEIESPKFGE